MSQIGKMRIKGGIKKVQGKQNQVAASNCSLSCCTLRRKSSSNKIWETAEINLCSESLRVKKAKIIHPLAAGKNIQTTPGKLKHSGHTEIQFFSLKCEENYLCLTIRVCIHIVTSLKNVPHTYQSIWLTACQSKANKWLCFYTFKFIQIFNCFEVKYLSLPESCNNNFNSPL